MSPSPLPLTQTREARPAPTSLMLYGFAHLLWRDLWVAMRDWRSFLATTMLQPVFFLLIFGRLLPQMGQANRNYTVVILPGIIGLTTVLTSMTSVILPLVVEFGFTKEIEDRLLSPLPIWSVAVQKMLYAAIRGLVAGTLVYPLGALILGKEFAISTEHFGLLILVSVLGALSAAAVGLTLGTLVPPEKVNLVLSLIITPLLFTGCVYYPWALLQQWRWFQVITCFSPLTYTSEGLRASLVPQIPHMSPAFVLSGQLAFLLLFGYLGVRGFLRKAVD